MLKTVIMGAMASIGAFAGVTWVGSSQAADEQRCRVDVAAFVKDMQALNPLQPDITADQIRKLLKAKP